MVRLMILAVALGLLAGSVSGVLHVSVDRDKAESIARRVEGSGEYRALKRDAEKRLGHIREAVQP